MYSWLGLFLHLTPAFIKDSDLRIILFRHRIEVLREIALRLRELRVFPPFRANRSCLYIVNIFSNNLLYSTLEYLATTRMQVRGRKHLDRKRKAAIALEVKVSEDIEVQC